jgi:hypothetical protein
MCQNAVIWYLLEKGRDMDLCSIFTARFAAGRDMDLCTTFTTRFESHICYSLYLLRKGPGYVFKKYFYYMFCRGYMIYWPAAYVVTFAWLCSYGSGRRVGVGADDDGISGGDRCSSSGRCLNTYISIYLRGPRWLGRRGWRR